MRRRVDGHYPHTVWVYEKLTGGIKAHEVGEIKRNKKIMKISENFYTYSRFFKPKKNLKKYWRSQGPRKHLTWKALQ